MTVSSSEAIFDALEPLRTEFALRRYKWALADARREVREDFRLLRLGKSSLSRSFVQFAETLNSENRLALLTGCIKRAYSRAAELLGDAVTPIEESLYNQEAAHVQMGIAKGIWPFGAQERAKIPRKEFRKFLRANLADRRLGEFDAWQLPAEWRYQMTIGNWVVETYIDTGGSFRQVGFSHAISARDGTPFLRHLVGGPCAGNNEWDMVTDSDLPHVADDIAVLARHFIDSMPELLAGLEVSKT